MEVGRRFLACGRPVLGEQTRGCGAVWSRGNLVEERAAETRGVGDQSSLSLAGDTCWPAAALDGRSPMREREILERESCSGERGGLGCFGFPGPIVPPFVRFFFSSFLAQLTCFSQVPTPNLLTNNLNSSRNILQLTSLIKLWKLIKWNENDFKSLGQHWFKSFYN